ncbi:hypothetical protein [Schumannella luteola]
MDLLGGAALAVGTVLVVVVGGGIVALVVVARRVRSGAIPRFGGTGIHELSRRAGTLLVRLDDRLRDADSELGYAIAQFGADAAKPWADALSTARAKVAEAYRLRHALDDAEPDSERETREWTLQIIALCEQAEKQLDEQDAAFTRLRGQEVNAEGTLREVRRRIEDARSRAAASRELLADLGRRFAPTTIAAIADYPAQAERLLDAAAGQADAAAAGVAPSGVSSVSGILAQAEQAVHRAGDLLDSVERTGRDLDAASAALATRRAELADDATQARAEIDSAPDPDSGAAILDALRELEAIEPLSPADPVRELDRLDEAASHLDLALAGSRNQKQRFAHALAAYEGTLVSARSQIAVARDLIAGGRAGVSARTRLAEAERQLAIAEAETDPVEKLDAVRRAVTHARDADALARYDLGG